MHLLKNTISFIAVLCVIPAAFAATARPGIIRTNVGTRMPTMTAYLGSLGGNTTTVTTTTTSSLLADAECIDAYTQCMKGADACGPNFEECTTNVLFHGKMPNCLSTLAQCSTAGINSLFGTSAVNSLATIATQNSYGEVTKYTYPTDGSVMGQMITGAAISNRYDTSTCVRRYTACLRKDTVCGSDFELCTTNAEFRKQRVLCDSTLARCQGDGLVELFGTSTTTSAPTATSRIGELITEGAGLAAVNAVSTCYKVIDQCILGACNANPYKCISNSNSALAEIVDEINTGTTASSESALTADAITNSAVAGYIRNACAGTIGANKYCYATFLGNGQMPTASQLADEDNQGEIFDMAYSARMNSGMRAQLQDIMNKFDTKAKQKCTETISSCVMRTCGSGLGSVCYSQVYGTGDKSINKDSVRGEVKTGCAAIVNTDSYCKYAAANPSAAGTYTYSYINADAFDTLFPEYDTGQDPIGVVAALNARLANNYSDAALAQMKKSCENIAKSCVKSMCGTDYVNCYRNRTDIKSSLTNTGNATFDNSMNKVGGVLDYTIVLGLCLDTVKGASVCEEHLAIEAAKIRLATTRAESSWGGASNVRQGWIDAGSATRVDEEIETVDAYDENGNKLCTDKTGNECVCDTVDDAGNVCDTPVRISYINYIQSQAASSLFKDLIYDIEKEAQAKYNAKLTKQQNMCMEGNAAGGIIGNRDMGSVYMWAKLKSNRVPNNYAVSGLKTSQFTASNDLYGSFCRIRVNIQSDDKNIQDQIRNGASWATAYFAAGDSFTCGSWISNSDLEKIANAVASKSTEQMEKNQKRLRPWMTALGTLGFGVAGGTGSYYLAESIQDGKFLPGLATLGDYTGKNEKIKQRRELLKKSNDYKDVAKSCMTNLSDTNNITNVSVGLSYAKMMQGVDGADTYGLSGKISVLESAMNNYNSGTNQTITEVGTREVWTSEYTNAWSEYKLAVDAAAAAAKNNNNCYNAIVGADYDTAKITAVINSGDCSNIATEVAAVSNKKEAVTQLENQGRKTTNQTYNTVTANSSYESNRSKYVAAVNDLRATCTAIAANGLNAEGVAVAQKRRSTITATTTAVGATVSAIAGGLIVNKMTRDIQESNLDKAQKEAYDEWMNEIGSHIQCYIGGDEVGSYGDVISTSLE